MKIAESLYTKGYISYPRTETNIYPKSFEFTKIIENLSKNNNYADHAN